MNVRTARSASAMALAITAALTISACVSSQATAPEDGSLVAEAPTPTEPTPTTGPTQTAAANPVFEQPETCAELLPTTRVREFERRSLELLGGPGGAYGTDYLADDTPEEQLGGISCFYGSEAIETDSIVISVAPLAPSTRPDVMDELLGMGLNETQDGTVIRYQKTGDEQVAPSEFHAVRGTSWISVVTFPGGESAHTEAREIADEVAKAVYR